MRRTVNLVKLAIESTAVVLARLGVVDEARGRRTADLAWPRVVTGLTRRSQTTADLAMVGLAIGPAAIAGVGFAFAYFMVANGLAFSLANGAMTFTAQRYGADDMAGLDVAIKQALWLELAVAAVVVGILAGFARPLIGLLGASPAALDHGATYLGIVALGFLFEMPNKVASRTLVSANDAWTPMVIRATGAIGNILLNALLVFGLGLGVAGAAIGTVVATALVAVAFGVGFVRGRLPVVGAFPVQVDLDGPHVDLALTKQMLEVSLPLMVKQGVTRGSNFVMLAIVAYFGTVVVAAYAVAREVRGLMNSPSWGFSTAARSLVGQALGADEEDEASAYGSDIIRFAGAVYVLMSVLMFAFAEQIATVFSGDPETIAALVPFVAVIAVSLVPFGVDNAASGVISAGGDTRWPLYARLVGLYGLMIPIAYLGVVTDLGILALYVALIAETLAPAVVVLFRFRTGKWKLVSRKYRGLAGD